MTDRTFALRYLHVFLVFFLTWGMATTASTAAAAKFSYLPMAPGIIVSPTSGLQTTEAGGTAQFTVVLAEAPNSVVRIGLRSSDTTEGTISTSSLFFNTSNWAIPQTVTITGIDDPNDDGDILYTIITDPATSSDQGYEGLNAEDVSVTNLDNDTAGITVNPTSGLVTTESGGTATFTVVLTCQPTANVSIGLSSSDTTEGTVSPGSLTFTSANWSTQQTVTVTGVDDGLTDGDVAYTIITAPATSADLSYNGLNAANVSVTNQDNDMAGITVNPTSGLVTSEAGDRATFTVVLNSQPSANVTIGLSSSDTTEGTVSPSSLTFTPANWSIQQTVTVTGVDDPVIDGNISYTVVTAPASSSDLSYNGLNAPDVSVTNTDNDVAGITVDPTSGLQTTEAGGIVTFTVVLVSQPSANVTIGLSSSDTTEGTVAPTSLVFTSLNWSTKQVVTVTGVNDTLADGNVGYTIVTAPAVSSDPAYNGVNAADVSVTNLDNDTAGILVNPTAGLQTTEAGGSDTFTVVLTSQPVANVTIGLSSSDITEGTVTPISLTFLPGNWSTAQTVTVTGVNDSLADGNINYSIVTAPAVSSDPVYNGLNAADVSVTNLDDDTAGITVDPISGLVTTEAGGIVTFTVVLNSEPRANVTINLSSSDPGEGVVQPTSLTFTSLNWKTARVVTVTGVDDYLDDGDQPYTIITAPAVSSDSSYNGLNASNVSVVNQDDDVAPIAQNDAYLTNATSTKPLLVGAPGVLGNDSDANNDPLTAVLSTNPISGTVKLNPDGSFEYSPNSGMIGVDTFSYRANDGHLNSNTATVSITVDPIQPTVQWVLPVGNGAVHLVKDHYVDSVLLRANAADNMAVSQVQFLRWDAPTSKYVTIAVETSSPYELEVEIQTFNKGWNQVFVQSRDMAGNGSSYQFIWIIRLSPEIFFPFVFR